MLYNCLKNISTGRLCDLCPKNCMKNMNESNCKIHHNVEQYWNDFCLCFQPQTNWDLNLDPLLLSYLWELEMILLDVSTGEEVRINSHLFSES